MEFCRCSLNAHVSKKTAHWKDGRRSTGSRKHDHKNRNRRYKQKKRKKSLKLFFILSYIIKETHFNFLSIPNGC